MCRGLLLAAVAVGVGLFGASLLRTEGRAAQATGAGSEGDATCAARTRSGAQCSRPAESGSEFCWQHRVRG